MCTIIRAHQRQTDRQNHGEQRCKGGQVGKQALDSEEEGDREADSGTGWERRS